MADKMPHNDSEQDIHTIDTTPTHLVGSVHKSICSDVTASSDEALDPDLQDQLDDLKKELKKKQRKRRFNEHQVQVHEKQNKKHRDDNDPDDNGGEGGKSDAKPPKVMAADAVVPTK